jgi:hypothetical protein
MARSFKKEAIVKISELFFYKRGIPAVVPVVWTATGLE